MKPKLPVWLCGTCLGLLLTGCVLFVGAVNFKPSAPSKHIRSPEELLQCAIDLENPALAEVKTAIKAGDYEKAKQELLKHFRARRSPLDPQVNHWKRITDRAFVDFWVKDAEDFPRRYSKNGRINWRNNNQVPRSQYESFEIRNRLINLAGWAASADILNSAVLRRQVIETFLDWYRDCPPPELPVSGWWDGHKTGFAWQEIEVALRGRMLLSIFFASLEWKEASSDFHLALLVSIHQSMDFLTSQYARFGFRPHNHQNIHGMTLLAGGVLLPEMKAAKTWKELGLHILRLHAQKDFHPDGVQVENSPHYHAKVFFVFLDAYENLRTNDQNEEAIAWLKQHLNQTADFLLYSCDGGGRHLPINDGWHTSDLALLSRAAQVLERPELLALEKHAPRNKLPPLSRVFPDAGIAYLRSGWGPEAVVVAVDASGHRSGHWHCGKPSILVHAGAQPLACHPQISNYDDELYWRYFKCAEASNTILVDGVGDAEPSGPWSYKRVPRPRLTEFRLGQVADIVSATTDGFLYLKPPVTFERTIVFIRPATVLVHDVLRCEQKRRYDWLLHLTPQEPVVDTKTRTLCTAVEGPYQLVAMPAPGMSSISGPELRRGKYHDCIYPAQRGYWFPLQFGDIPALVTDAPVAVWLQKDVANATFDMVLAVIQKGQRVPALARLKDIDLPGVAVYQVGLPDQEVIVVFDDRPANERSPITIASRKLSGRVSVLSKAELLSIP
jgi:hypothetical protein